ncbi:hypothetical protein [Streptomyces sp. NPDC048606]|uniref:hypothetical protein n=1 Tax=Streptomyces sp. NPDC048606 TaxID=3154726 RepID=UPI00342A4AD3
MWEGCTPVLGAEPEPSRREIAGWKVPGIGEMDVESHGFRSTVLPANGSLSVELAFRSTYVESATTPYRPLGPVTLVLDGVRSLDTETPETPSDPLWKRALRGDGGDALLRMSWDQEEDVLYVGDGRTTLRCRGGTWRWRLDTTPGPAAP